MLSPAACRAAMSSTSCNGSRHPCRKTVQQRTVARPARATVPARNLRSFRALAGVCPVPNHAARRRILAMPTGRLACRLPSTCGNVFRGGKTRLKMHLNDIAHGPAGAKPRGPPLSCQNQMPDDAKTRGSGCRKDQINTTTWKETGNPSRTTPDSQKHPVRNNPVN